MKEEEEEVKEEEEEEERAERWRMGERVWCTSEGRVRVEGRERPWEERSADATRHTSENGRRAR